MGFFETKMVFILWPCGIFYRYRRHTATNFTPYIWGVTKFRVRENYK